MSARSIAIPAPVLFTDIGISPAWCIREHTGIRRSVYDEVCVTGTVDGFRQCTRRKGLNQDFGERFAFVVSRRFFRHGNLPVGIASSCFSQVQSRLKCKLDEPSHIYFPFLRRSGTPAHGLPPFQYRRHLRKRKSVLKPNFRFRSKRTTTDGSRLIRSRPTYSGHPFTPRWFPTPPGCTKGGTVERSG